MIVDIRAVKKGHIDSRRLYREATLILFYGHYKGLWWRVIYKAAGCRHSNFSGRPANGCGFKGVEWWFNFWMGFWNLWFFSFLYIVVLFRNGDQFGIFLFLRIYLKMRFWLCCFFIEFFLCVYCIFILKWGLVCWFFVSLKIYLTTGCRYCCFFQYIEFLFFFICLFLFQ